MEAARTAAEPMPTGLATMARSVAFASNYHRWLFGHVRPWVGRRVLEIGAGAGGVTRCVADIADVTAIDLSAGAIDALRGILGDHPRVRTRVGDVCDPAVVADLVRQDFDTVLSSNVLEHIEDDVGALRNLRTILAGSGGRALFIVPSHQWLYGTLDEAAGHYRRYTRRTLAKAFTDAGFTVERTWYVNAIGALGWWVNGRVLRTRQIDAPSIESQAATFDKWIVPVVRRVEAVIPPPFGQSVIAVARATP